MTQAGIPEIVGCYGACIVAMGLTVSHLRPLNLVVTIMEESAGIVTSFTEYSAYVSI